MPAGFGEACAGSAGSTAVESSGGGDGHGAAAGLSVFGSEPAWPGVAATTVLSAAAEVTAGDIRGLGKVTADPPGADLAGAASSGAALACFPSAGAASAGFASAGEEDLPAPPLPLLPGDDVFELVVRDAGRRGAVAGAGFAPEEETDRVFSAPSAVSADVDEEPSASAAVKLLSLSSPSGVSPFLLTDSGLGSTLFRTTVSG